MSLEQLSSDEIGVIVRFLPMASVDDWGTILSLELTCTHCATCLHSVNAWKELFLLNFPSNLQWIKNRYGISPYDTKPPFDTSKNWSKKHLAHSVRYLAVSISDKCTARAREVIEMFGDYKMIEKEIKIAVVGRDGSGKSALVVQAIAGMFVEMYDSTIEDTYRKLMVVDGFSLNLDILDSVSDERFTRAASFFSGAHVFIGVYDVSCQDSMDYLYHKMKDIATTYYPQVKDSRDMPFIIAETKVDLDKYGIVYWDKFFSGNRDVWMRCEKMSFFDHFVRVRVSSKLAVNTQLVFEQAARIFLKRRKVKSTTCNIQ